MRISDVKAVYPEYRQHVLLPSDPGRAGAW